MSNTLFPVYIYEEGLELPTEGTYFLVSGNGLWLHKDTGIVKAFVPVDNISVLQELDAEAKVNMNMPKLPARHVYKIKKFFQKVVEIHRSEAAVVLYYNKQTGDFKIQVADQKVSHGGVFYKRVGLSHTEDMADYLRVGTIHSHCDFGAFHSGTDVDDEEDFDGLHCTFGHNDKDNFTITASIVVNGNRLQVNPTKVLDGITPIKNTQPEEEKSKTLWEQMQIKASQKQSCKNLFTLSDPDEITLSEWAEEKDKWLSHVQGTSWFAKKSSDGIVEGTKVTWAGDLDQVQLRDTMGDGPFNVLNRENDKVTIETKVGLAKLSVKLFRKDTQ